MKEKQTYRPTDAPEHTLPEATRKNPFSVPGGYFADLHQRTLLQCRLVEEEPHTWSVPPGYFEQLGNQIAAKIDEQKLKEAVPETGFSVPEGYFDQLEARLPLQRKREEHTPVRKIIRSTWMAYAAAACVAVVVGFFGIANWVNERPASATGGTLASVSDQEILNYLEFYGTTEDMLFISEHLDDVDVPNIGAGIHEEDIEEYLNHTL